MKQANKHHIMARYSVVVLVMLLFAGCIVYELFKTAVTYAEEWNLKSKNILCDSTIIEPERGRHQRRHAQEISTCLVRQSSRLRPFTHSPAMER